MSELFDKQLQSFHISLDHTQKMQFQTFYEMLVEWNKVMNLTGITEYEEVNLKHFTDSLSLVRVEEMDHVKNMIDVGTGAGFPGIPIKIAFPHVNVVLLDSLKKRVNFLNQVIKELGLTKITAIHGRAEDYARNTMYREKFDLCVSRAVANLSTLCEYCLPFVAKEGRFISYKGGESDQEVDNSKNAIVILGGSLENVDKFLLPGSDINRSLISVRKFKNTPGKYPRKSGLPAKEPIV